jgi:uncharacterized protein
MPFNFDSSFSFGWLRSVLFGALALGVVTPVLAASFDCKLAKTATERAVCSDWRVSTFDEVLAAKYLEALDKAGDSARLRADQHTWLRLRNSCDADVACLGKAYESRLAALKTDRFEFDDGVTLLGCDGTAETATLRRVAQPDANTAHSPMARIPKGTVVYQELSPDKPYRECRFASGRSIRIKVGMYELYPYGRCGADPGSFFSAWVDQKKLASRVDLRSSCGFGGLVKAELSIQALKTCHASVEGELDCRSTPLTASDPRDLEEYPLRPIKKGSVGSYVIEYAADKTLCREMLSGRKDDPSFSSASIGLPSDAMYVEDAMQQPSGGPATKVFISRFDMDNDGKSDSVVSLQFDSRWRESTTFFAHRQDLADKEVADVTAEFLRKSSFAVYPHAWGNCSGGFNRNDWDDADCTLPLQHFAPGGRPFSYDIKALTLYPFLKGNKTYFLGMGRHYLSESVAAVWEPKQNGKAKEVCIFRRLLENY